MVRLEDAAVDAPPHVLDEGAERPPLIVMRSQSRYPLSVGITSLIGQYEARWDLVISMEPPPT
jgi:hypothetical protein